MAISTGSKIAISLIASQSAQQCYMVWTYNVLEIIGTPTAAHYSEAWWNHVKTLYRALPVIAQGNVFLSVKTQELGNPTGEYGEYGIPIGEQVGTRANPTDSDFLPAFNAVGVRLTVGTRATRPGQKRFPFLTQNDVLSNAVQTSYITPLTTLMNLMTANMTLGAPAAGVVLVSTVVGLNADGTIRASQFVTGHKVNPTVTSQVSRKVGRGI